MKLSGRFSSLNTEREGDLARLLLGGLIIKSQINMEDIFDDGLPQIQHIVKVSPSRYHKSPLLLLVGSDFNETI